MMVIPERLVLPNCIRLKLLNKRRRSRIVTHDQNLNG